MKTLPPWVRGLLAATAVVILCIGAWWWWTGGGNPSAMGEPPTRELDRLERSGIPTIPLKTLDGADFDLKKWQDHMVIINFWASWCDPCVREFPNMVKLIERFKGRVVLIAISGDDNKDDPKKFLKAFGGSHPFIEVLWDPSSRVAQEFGTKKIPESYILDRHHRFVRKVVGLEDWASQDVVAYFEELDKSAAVSQ